MNCEMYIELMSAALDGACTADERRELDRHLAVCPECAELFNILSANAKAARDLDCQVPADLKDRIMRNLPEQDAAVKQGKVIRWKRWAPIAAAACLILVVSLIPGTQRKAMDAENSAPNAALPSSMSEYDRSEARDGRDGLTDDTAEAPQGESCNGAIPAESYECEGELSLSFSHPQAIYVHYGATPAPGALIISSADSLARYLAQYGSQQFDEAGSPIPIAELETLKQTYTGDFFRSRSLVCVLVESGSGSNRYEIVELSHTAVTVQAQIPEVGTCDMAAWLLVAELDSILDDNSTLEVNIVR